LREFGHGIVSARVYRRTGFPAFKRTLVRVRQAFIEIAEFRTRERRGITLGRERPFFLYVDNVIVVV
jgi:hypothetical protein